MNGFLTRQMSGFSATYRRELGAYFATPMAYVFLAVFLLALGMFTWEAGRFFDTGVADLQPFFAGTYFPPEDGRGMPGLKRILGSLTDAWKNDRAEIRNR